MVKFKNINNSTNIKQFHCFTDECESEEDVITDYLVERGGRMDSVPVTHTGSNPGTGQGPLVPIISVTPHSPAGKHYSVLGKHFY